MAFLEKGLLLYLCLAIGCSFWQPNIIFGNQNMLTTMFDIGGTDNGTVTNFGNSVLAEADPSDASKLLEFQKGKDSTSGFQWIVDPLGNVIHILGTFFSILFSPFIIFSAMIGFGAPVAVMFVFGLPLVLLVYLGIMIFVRGGAA